MKNNGSFYVVVVLAALAGYFVYQWWFNPNRKVKARLGEIAATLSIPADEAELGRITRLAQLRKFVTADVHVSIGKKGPELQSKDAVMGAVAAFTPPPGGWNLDFVNSDVRVNSDDTARAFATAEVTSRDSQGNKTVDTREVDLRFMRVDGDWLVSEAEVKDLPTPQ